MSTDSDTITEQDENEKQSLDLSIEITEPTACERHIAVTIARPDVDRYIDEAFSEMMDEANVPGFRPGRAPRKLVESHFRKDILQQVKGSLLLDSITQVTEDQEFSAISEPVFDVDAVEVPEEGPMTFEFDIEVRPEFEMPKWQGLKIEKPTREFTDKDIDEQISRVVADSATWEPHEGEASEEDMAVVNLTVKHNDNVVRKLEDIEIQVRPTVSFFDGNIEDFDKLIVGEKIGSQKTAEMSVSYSAPNEELRGETVSVEVELLDLKRLQLPTLDESILQKMGAFENEGELRDAVKGELERQLNYAQNRRIREQITSLLTEAADWELPPDLLKRQAQRELNRAVMELRRSGFGEQEIRAHENTLRQNSEETTATALKEHFILERLAEDQEIEADDNDYDQEIMLMAMQQGESPRAVRARIEKQGLMDALRNQIIERKAIELVEESATFEEVPYEPPRQKVYAVGRPLTGELTAEIPAAKHGESEELQQPADHT